MNSGGVRTVRVSFPRYRFDGHPLTYSVGALKHAWSSHTVSFHAGFIQLCFHSNSGLGRDFACLRVSRSFPCKTPRFKFKFWVVLSQQTGNAASIVSEVICACSGRWYPGLVWVDMGVGVRVGWFVRIAVCSRSLGAVAPCEVKCRVVGSQGHAEWAGLSCLDQTKQARMCDAIHAETLWPGFSAQLLESCANTFSRSGTVNMRHFIWEGGKEMWCIGSEIVLALNKIDKVRSVNVTGVPRRRPAHIGPRLQAKDCKTIISVDVGLSGVDHSLIYRSKLAPDVRVCRNHIGMMRGRGFDEKDTRRDTP
ncbi:hypothetical protein B0H17DRAFT_1145134 [Mycena rosella]|uniref:Uncharacterized protein n=1 Tax=Mycena rosella TaxID=1033263 RepID=A0AAD7CRZ8_MYCRO|nr:hypothetical protein B0H17DRAFT_1145134 [Mycena rosella]